ncbi:hypothetical protein M947_09635 [Sulfurimonas hongkongensis]|uniref:Uncharacterized protein n=1 Tax=Sulfurimonas hongkongensis TaxID=1172190 RepID=T0KQD4_9BACT|nr:hypothetical protein M947_09635 [Sulfurimonas hongkongensis]
MPLVSIPKSPTSEGMAYSLAPMLCVGVYIYATRKKMYEFQRGALELVQLNQPHL